MAESKVMVIPSRSLVGICLPWWPKRKVAARKRRDVQTVRKVPSPDRDDEYPFIMAGLVHIGPFGVEEKNIQL